ncbi:uncharacterized protein KY384_004846 [Bacidia gigantensis]|uniref:uncharacterized protein n=1 Tax=Bacidia gigantensis TaxID=2732470 RepID=UPI001D0420CE|nr:uncharacterized protein KY384_004846 [Bacidia gigantensis]KAG8530344.1 hypothetical protein KY384_004846 [Bacidia gigantensis]
MGPRKRAKPNPKDESDAKPTAQNGDVESKASEQETSASLISGFPNSTSGEEYRKTSENGGTNTPKSAKSWYGGSWPRGNKSTPVAQVAKESISAVASEVVASARARTPPLPSTPLRNTLGRQASHGINKPSPLSAETTRLNVTANGGTSAKGLFENVGINDKHVDTAKINAESERDAKNTAAGDAEVNEVTVQDAKSSAIPNDQERRSSGEPKKGRESGNWLLWFSKIEQARSLDDGGDSCQSGPGFQAKGWNDPPRIFQQNDADSKAQPNLRQDSITPPKPETTTSVSQDRKRSWLGLWGNNTTPTPTGSASTTAGTPQNALGKVESPTQVASTTEGNNEYQKPKNPSTADADDSMKASSWAFWTRETGTKQPGNTTGELALAGSPSQSKPEKDTVDEAKGIPVKVEKRQNASNLEASNGTSKPDKASQIIKEAEQPNGQVVRKASKKVKDFESQAKKEPPNLLLPSFLSTYGTTNKTSLIQQIGQWLPFAAPFNHPRHLEPLNNPIKVKKALVIGVHGFFPTPLVRSLLGQPTGTSLKFANMGASAIQHWTQAQGYSCEIDKVALEGEGKIAYRIETLWNLLLNWIDKIRKADFIFVACHSQGCPVALMLVAKLISFGCVSSARIGVCAMAGVNQGPFIDYKNRWIGATALELFEFARPDSKVSKDYEASLASALKFGVKVLYVGSIDDQLVSLESSTFGTIHHPNIYRAVFVDGRVHAPDFLTHLVGFALKLRNLGISDHGLIRELSSPLAGSLYSGEGHSRIYEDEAVYHLAIEHTLATTLVGTIPLHVQGEGSASGQNPYILPFAMRGLLEEHFVRTELYSETTDLIHKFDDWKPHSKVLKDVKFRLEGVRSKL